MQRPHELRRVLEQGDQFVKFVDPRQDRLLLLPYGVGPGDIERRDVEHRGQFLAVGA
jgi:hypothetical protein